MTPRSHMHDGRFERGSAWNGEEELTEREETGRYRQATLVEYMYYLHYIAENCLSENALCLYPVKHAS